MAFAAWFGLLATALNLFPIGQLDGGHIAYAVLGRRSTLVTFVTIGVAIGLTFVSSSWIVWTDLMVVMLFLVGPHHPPTLDDDAADRPGPAAAGGRRAGDADRLLHAGADQRVHRRAAPRRGCRRRSDDLGSPKVGAALSVRRAVRASTSGSTSTEIRFASLGWRDTASCSASRIAFATDPLQEELRAVFAAQPRQRRRRRTEDRKALRAARAASARSARRSIASSKVLPRTTTLTMATSGG